MNRLWAAHPSMPTLMKQERVQPLPPAAPVLGERLAQPGAVAQPLDLLGRDPRLGQHLLSPTAAQASARRGDRSSRFVGDPAVPAPAPARPAAPRTRSRSARARPNANRSSPRSLRGRDPSSPLLSPASETRTISREARLSHLTTLRIEHRRLERVLMDVDRRVQHHGPPLVEQRPDRRQRSGQSPMTST